MNYLADINIYKKATSQWEEAMSHMAKIELEINDLNTLDQACKRLGLALILNQRSYRWFGQWIGDHPLPDGFTTDDLGKCDHVITVPGAQYDIGVVKKNGKHILLWDFWISGGLEEVLGPGAGKLKQAYAVSKATIEAKKKGYRVMEKKTETGIRLTLRGGR